MSAAEATVAPLPPPPPPPPHRPLLRKSASHSSLGRVMSHGRGGAGNISLDDNDYSEDVDEVKIPTLGHVYTTGRGGTGNMMVNDPAKPHLARLAHDVEEVPPIRVGVGEFHGGRGGVGNVVKPVTNGEAGEEKEKGKGKMTEKVEKPRDVRGWADRGKDLILGKCKFLRKKEPVS